MADDQVPAPGTIGRNTISRAELGAYYRRLGYSRGGDAAAAVFDDITARRQPYEPAGETGARADPPPPVAADLEVAALQTSAGCDRLDRMVTEYGDATGAVRQAVDLLGARIHSAEDARIISAARDALRVLEGAETPAGGTVPDDTGRVLPASPGRSREQAGVPETPRPWTAADERGRILAIAECLKSEFTVTARNSEGTRTVTVQAVPYEALRSMALLGDGPGERAGAERLRALGVTGEARERGEDEEVRTS